jgi:WD40-like Beta Propeller Repeat
VAGVASESSWVTVMDDLRRRFASLDRATPPDLWGRIEKRAAAMESVARVTGVVTPMPLAARRSTSRTLVVLLTVLAVLGALVAGALVVGSGLVRRPAVVPVAIESASAVPSAAALTPLRSITPAPSGIATSRGAPWIVFHARGGGNRPYDGTLWAMRSDGTGAHAIEVGPYANVAWSRDGSRLLLNNGHLLEAEVGEQIGAFVDTGVDVPDADQWEGFDFAPDGERVVHVQRPHCSNATTAASGSSGLVLAVYVADTAGAYCYTLNIVDLRTGRRTDLGRTLVKDQTATQNVALELPAWAPDGTKIAYTRLDERLDARELWIVNADGTSPSRVALDGDVSVMDPRWSPDGTRIAFTSLTWPSATVSDSAVYVAALSSGHLELVTTGSGSAANQACCAEWIDNDHLRVSDPTSPDRFYQVPLDAGSGEARLLVDLTDALAAIRSSGPVVTVSAPGDPGRRFFWQPTVPAP